MLPAEHRLSDSDTFRTAVRSGRRAGSRNLVVHLWSGDQTKTAPALIGFTVGKAVGNAVVRNRVKRRLRHLTREHLPRLAEMPGRPVVVVRALPASARASSADLDNDLSRLLGRVVP